MINEYIKNGKIVPVEVTLGLIKKAMIESGAELFLIDGFPRNFDQLDGWNDSMGHCDVECVLFYECSEDVMAERILQRGHTSGRVDDNAEVLRKRFRTYLHETMPVVTVFEKQGKVRRIAAEAAPEYIFEASKLVVGPMVEAQVLSCNKELLSAIAAGDYAAYTELCAEDISCFESEAVGHRVDGLPFHKFYFDNGNSLNKGGGHQSTMVDAKVKLFGDVALVTYTRLVQTVTKEGFSTCAHNETRIWHRQGSNWKNVHFHRSPAM
jgi:UMP-CMP kinase